jgi:hypothetical protein
MNYAITLLQREKKKIDQNLKNNDLMLQDKNKARDELHKLNELKKAIKILNQKQKKMKNTILTLCLVLAGLIPAVAHPGHQSTPHIHLSESVSIGIAIVLTVVLSIIGFYLIRKYVNKRSHAN